MTFAIHPFGAEDWELMRALRLATLSDAPRAFGSSFEEERTFTESYWQARASSGHSLRASDDGEPAGTVGVRPDEDGNQLMVWMWVVPAYRGSGVADLLVEAAVAMAAGCGSDSLRLWVETENTAARKLYARHGFEPTGRTEPMRGIPGRIQLEMVRR